jgi:MFS family permease
MYGETMLLPAIPDLVHDFKIPYNTSSWILTAYLVTGAIMTPIAGKLSDVYGKKKVLVIIMGIYTAGTLLGGISYDFVLIILSRVIQGLGLAMFPVAFGIIREKFPEEKLAIGQAIFTAVFSGGAIIGLGIGASIVEYLGWRMTFFTVIPFAIALFLVIIKHVHVYDEKLYYKAKYNIVDIKGTLILIVMVSSFLIALTSLPILALNYEKSNLIIVISLFMLSAGLLPFFIRVQRNSNTPLMDLQLLKDSILLPTNILIMTIGISIFVIYQSVPILIQSPQPLGFGGSPVDAASIQLPFMVLSFVISVCSGFLITKIGNLKPTILGCLITTIGFLLILIYHSNEFIIAIDLSIVAIGLSFAEVGAFNIILVYSPLRLSGTSVGITMLLFLIGMAIGPAISGIFLQLFQSSVQGVEGSFPSAFSYIMIFLTAMMVSIFSLILILFVSKILSQNVSLKS